MDGGITMSLDFEMTELEIQKMYDREATDIEEIRLSITKGSGMKPESLKLYNRYMKRRGEEPIRAGKYISDDFDCIEVDRVEHENNCTVYFMKKVFDVELDMREASTVSHDIFQSYCEGMSKVLEHKIINYYAVLHTIKTAHKISDTSMRKTKKILDALGVEFPKELKIAEYVKDHYAKTQLAKAVMDALNDIFPQIKDKSVLEKIAAKALE